MLKALAAWIMYSSFLGDGLFRVPSMRDSWAFADLEDGVNIAIDESGEELESALLKARSCLMAN